MRFNLAAEARRAKAIRRKSIVLGEVAAPAMLATDLYRSVYAPLIKIWTEATKPIAEEYARTLAQLTTDSPADLQGQIDAADSLATRLFLTLTPSLMDWALKVERATRLRFVRQVFSATSVDLSTRLGPTDVQESLDAYLRWNVDLIADVSAQIKKRIADSVFTGLTQRKPAREVAKEISNAVGMGRKRALNIASDQLAKLSGSLADERRRQAGMTEWTWQHGGKVHYRPEHLARNGFIYTDNPTNVGKRVGGKEVRSPPERGDLPAQKPYCSCRSRSLLVWEFDAES